MSDVALPFFEDAHFPAKDRRLRLQEAIGIAILNFYADNPRLTCPEVTQALSNVSEKFEFNARIAARKRRHT